MSARIVKKRVLVMKCQGCGENCRVDNMNIREKMCIDCVEQLMYLYQYELHNTYLNEGFYYNILSDYADTKTKKLIEDRLIELSGEPINVYMYYPSHGGFMWLIELKDEELFVPIYTNRFKEEELFYLFFDHEDDILPKRSIVEIKNMCPIEYADFLEKLQ